MITRASSRLPDRMAGTRLGTCNRGSFLLWALGINGLVLLLVVSLLPFFQTVVRAPALAYRHDQARQLAEAGISDALLWLNPANGPYWPDALGWWDPAPP